MLSLRKLACLLGLATVSVCQSDTSNTTLPYAFGMIVFPGFQALDVFGPLDALNVLAFTTKINLTVIADTLEPVTTNKVSWTTSAVGATFGETILPSHTFATAPPLDVLLIPGGLGTRAPGTGLDSTIAFIRERYPTVKYLISVCTGAGVVARAGVLDGKCATTNKKAWASTTPWGPKVKWVAEARWVQDGNIWTSSGVSAGIDVTIAWIASVFGEAKAVDVANGMEYHRQTNSTDDPFAGLYGLTNAKNSTNQAVDKC
ncbi:class I glutamine amidotransferase-like protein [Rhexocercosporidium sp. MPI-PUGE-AT-0058]|nr:class I glutamine amidotransferase-like protein [Rhexocercosporidium sp. MPI-PUGE-AT-0058]